MKPWYETQQNRAVFFVFSSRFDLPWVVTHSIEERLGYLPPSDRMMVIDPSAYYPVKENSLCEAIDRSIKDGWHPQIGITPQSQPYMDRNYPWIREFAARKSVPFILFAKEPFLAPPIAPIDVRIQKLYPRIANS